MRCCSTASLRHGSTDVKATENRGLIGWACLGLIGGKESVPCLALDGNRQPAE
jgi:hypothetical protein